MRLRELHKPCLPCFFSMSPLLCRLSTWNELKGVASFHTQSDHEDLLLLSRARSNLRVAILAEITYKAYSQMVSHVLYRHLEL